MKPKWHYRPEKNWINDPNGFVYYRGYYHLFYQYNPHGDQWGEDAPPAMAKGNILITGHTHVAACTKHDDFLYLNPGSPALPKDEGHRGYLLVDSEGAAFCEMDGTVYREVKF